MDNFTGGPQLQECGICSNGPHKIYHIGGPCPYINKVDITIEPFTDSKPFVSDNCKCKDIKKELNEMKEKLQKIVKLAVLSEAEKDKAWERLYEIREIAAIGNKVYLTTKD